MASCTDNRSVGDPIPSQQTREQVETLARALRPFDRNAHELAVGLLREFGSLAGVIEASPEDLKIIEGTSKGWVERFTALRTLMQIGMRESVSGTCLFGRGDTFNKYLIASLGRLKHERIVAFFSDERGVLLADETVAEGERGQVILPIRRIVGRALALNSAGVLIAHNHPSGSLQPSRADIEGTARLQRSFDDLGLHLIDHLIVAKTRIARIDKRGAV